MSSTSGNTATVLTAVDAIAFIVIIVVVVWFLCKLANNTFYSGNHNPDTVGLPVNQADPVEIKPEGIAGLQQFSIEEVMQITDNLKVKLGEGGFGPVYYGKLDESGKQVAVKRLSTASRQGATEFVNEVAILSRVHHHNLVALIGYCNQFDERILIYEFMPKGSLHDHLYGQSISYLQKSTHLSMAFMSTLIEYTVLNSLNVGVPALHQSLDWLARLRIAVNAANGLKYLHSDCIPKIIHRDIKSTNILLDEKLTGKLADFGISKLMSSAGIESSHVSTNVKGTFGYLDPEYAIHERLTEKSDVYSFGIVLLQLISGRKAVIESSTPEPAVVNLKDWAGSYIRAGNIQGIVDRKLGDNINMEALKKMADIALSSGADQSANRPTSSEVLKMLEEALQLELCTREMLHTSS